MIEQRLTHEGHIRRFIIDHAQTGGWELREEMDSREVRRSRYSDWHRVEQAVRMKVCLLQRDGWDVQVPA